MVKTKVPGKKEIRKSLSSKDGEGSRFFSRSPKALEDINNIEEN